VTAPLGFEERLARFRREFDEAFAAPPTTTVEASEDLLAIRIAGHPYALRMREIREVVASRKIVALPSHKAELLGLAGIHGSLVAVYSLAALLGHRADSKPLSWFALAGGADPVGLAFEQFEGFLRVRAADVHATHPAETGKPPVGQVVRAQGQSRRIVDIPSTLGALEIHTGLAGPPKES
jgi:chemotaxis signal transduction protein